jgi:hypothetical protein
LIRASLAVYVWPLLIDSSRMSVGASQEGANGHQAATGPMSDARELVCNVRRCQQERWCKGSVR